MAEVTNNFLKGVMNKDIDENLLPNGSYRDALNIEITHSEGDDAGNVRNKKGNTRVGVALNTLGNVTGRVTTTARTIGATTSDSDNLIYYLVTADTFDGVFEYNESMNTVNMILQSNKASASAVSKFNFNKDHYVTGMDYIDGFLYWTDNLNPPRRINVSRARTYDIDDSRIDDDISVILAAPLNAPTIDMVNDNTIKDNNLEEKFVQFSYRFKYVDNQYSAMSPFSGMAFIPSPYEVDYGVGENKGMMNSMNKVDISFETGNQFVEEIELLMRDTKSMNISVVESFNKITVISGTGGTPGISDNNIHTYPFSNSKVYSSLPSNQLARLFDNVPLKAKAQAIIDRRIVYGNYETSYDISDSIGQPILIDYKVGYVSQTANSQAPSQTFRSDRDYEIGIQYGDAYGRFTTVLTAPVIDSTIYVPPLNSNTGNSITVAIDNKPPEFASNYRLVIKQSKGKYYNIFPTLFYSEGLFRYFLINDFDRDKIPVGEYVIFKSDLGGPTFKNTRYKVIELDSKAANFLGGSQVPGLYFKIKVDNITELSETAQVNHITHSHGSASQDDASGGWIINHPVYFDALNIDNVAEPAIHYGTGDPGIVTVAPASLQAPLIWADIRFTVKIISQNQFELTADPTANGGWSTQGIPSGSTGTQDISLVHNTMSINITWTKQAYYQVGDYWKINCRANQVTSYNAGTFGQLNAIATNPYKFYNSGGDGANGIWGGSCIMPSDDFYGGTSATPESEIIFQGAIIGLEVIKEHGTSGESTNTAAQPPMFYWPPSPSTYANIEEWWYETQAYDDFVYPFSQGGGPLKGMVVGFRRGRQTLTNGTDHFYLTSPGVYDQSTSYAPVFMIFNGQGYVTGVGNNGLNHKHNVIETRLSINQSQNLPQCETVAIDNDADIYHETSRTYPIVGGLHTSRWAYESLTASASGKINLGQIVPGGVPGTQGSHVFQVGDKVRVQTPYSSPATLSGSHTIIEVPDKYNIVIDLDFSSGSGSVNGFVGFYHDEWFETDQIGIQPARILINAPSNTNSTYNAYSFGNGLESDRIRDNFNSTTLEYSPRASTTIEGYEKTRKESSLTYSSTYRDKTSTNGLNEFNLSLVNFKNLDMEFGSIQKLHARDTDLLVLQEDKVSRVLYGKNLLSDAVGGGAVTSSPQVLGNQISDKGEWGISFNPESFAEWGGSIYWTDSRRGSVLTMGQGGIATISSLGMKSYFRDIMQANPNTQKLGVFDPHTENYIIASNESPSRACNLTINRNEKDYPATKPSVNGINVAPAFGPDFIINGNGSWTAAIAYSAGSNWVNGWPASGFGSESVYLDIANNTTNANRTAVITITYCTNLTVTFTIKQARGKPVVVHPWVINIKD
mgnify:CR=1 FL=1